MYLPAFKGLVWQLVLRDPLIFLITLIHIENGCFTAYDGQIFINNVTRLSMPIGIELLQENENIHRIIWI